MEPRLFHGELKAVCLCRPGGRIGLAEISNGIGRMAGVPHKKGLLLLDSGYRR